MAHHDPCHDSTDPETDYSRRGLLQAGSVVSAMLLAGCSGDGPGEQDPDTDSSSSEENVEPTEQTTEDENNSPEESTEELENEPECDERRAVTDPSNPGHSWGDAPLISEGRHGPYELDLETRDSQNREHYFGVCLQEEDSLTVTMHFTRPDLDMSIHSPETNDQHEQYASRPQYREIATSWSTTPNETVNITANTSGTHYIRTYIVTYGVSGSYELEVEIE